MHYFDTFIQQYFSLHQNLFLTKFFYLLTILFDFSVTFVLVVLAIAGLVYLVRNIQYSALLLCTVFGGAGAVYILKHLFNVARPVGGVLAVPDPSFPSWHATSATIVFTMLMYIFDKYLEGGYRTVFNVFCIVMIFLISFSRVYLGVHWVSDVVAGIVTGLVTCFIASSIFKKYVLKYV